MPRWILALTAFLPAAPALAEWRAAETAHFIIYSESSDREIEKLAERLESYDKLMRMATNVSENEKPVKVRIYEVDSTHDIEKALGVSSTGIAGFYSSNIFGPFLVTPRSTTYHTASFTPELVLQHEYAHHFMLQYFPAIYPGWYTEGFAELIGSSKQLPDGRIGYGMPAKHRGNEIAAYWIPLTELLTKDKVRYLDTYGQGWALTHYFTFDSERAELLRQYLRAISGGKSRAEAAKVFGDLAALNRDARRYVTSGSFDYKPVKVEIRRPVIQRTRVLSAGEAALVPNVIAFSDEDLAIYRKPGRRKRQEELREANLRDIRQKARRFPNDPAVLYVLAEAESLAGDYRGSDTATDRLLAIQANHVRGLVRKSLNMSQAASSLQGQARAQKAAEARRLAVRANKLDVEDPLPLLAYYQSFHVAGGKAPKEAVTGLMQVVSTLPDNTTARQLLVDQLAAERRWAEAIAWLQPIANSSHESPLRAAAREKMEKLQGELAKEQGAAPQVATG